MNQLTPVERALGILEWLQPPPNRQTTIQCPTPEHEDRNPAARLYPDGHWYCFACEANGDALDLYALQRGLTIRQALDQLDCFRDDLKVPIKPQSRPVDMPESVRDILLSSAEFAERWEVAKTLALLEPTQQKREVLASWDYLERFDIPEVLRLVHLIRGVALFRYAKPAKAHLPSERTRAVRHLLREAHS